MKMARLLRQLHLLSMVVWIILVYPTLAWWSQSIPWLSFMSIYAIIGTHFASWQSSRVEVKAEKHHEEVQGSKGSGS
jgi:hypothetical protein